MENLWKDWRTDGKMTDCWVGYSYCDMSVNRINFDLPSSLFLITVRSPDSKVHGANMGPTWDRQDSGGSHVGPMDLAIWDTSLHFILVKLPWILLAPGNIQGILTRMQHGQFSVKVSQFCAVHLFVPVNWLYLRPCQAGLSQAVLRGNSILVLVTGMDFKGPQSS